MRRASSETTGLWWSRKGEVRCSVHFAEVAEPSRADDRWAPIPASAQGVRHTFYRCELCAPDGRPIRHSDPSPAVLDAVAARKDVRQARRACREAREQAALTRWYSYSERVHRQSTHQ